MCTVSSHQWICGATNAPHACCRQNLQAAREYALRSQNFPHARDYCDDWGGEESSVGNAGKTNCIHGQRLNQKHYVNSLNSNSSNINPRRWLPLGMFDVPACGTLSYTPICIMYHRTIHHVLLRFWLP